jgi:hypothetical protein
VFSLYPEKEGKSPQHHLAILNSRSFENGIQTLYGYTILDYLKRPALEERVSR